MYDKLTKNKYKLPQASNIISEPPRYQRVKA